MCLNEFLSIIYSCENDGVEIQFPQHADASAIAMSVVSQRLLDLVIKVLLDLLSEQISRHNVRYKVGSQCLLPSKFYSHQQGVIDSLILTRRSQEKSLNST